MPQDYSACFPNGTPPTLYLSTGATTSFTIGFPYQKTSDVVVYTGTADPANWVITPTADYSITGNPAQVVFTVAPNSDVLIMRRTELCDERIDFQAGQSIRAQDLNTNFQQQLFLSQELYEYLSGQVGGGPLIPGIDLTQDFLEPNQVLGGNGIDTVVAGQNVTINQSQIAGVAGSYTAADITVDNMGRVTAAANGVANITAGDGIRIDAPAEINIDLAATPGLQFPGGNLQVIGNSVTEAGGNVQLTNGPSNVTITGGGGIAVTRTSATELTITDTVDNNTTYDLSSVADTGNVNLRLTSTNPAGTDDVLITAGINVNFTNIGPNGFQINASGGGSGGATVVDDCDDLNTEAAKPPGDGDLFIVLDSSNMTRAAGASPGNTTAINGLPETVADGQPVGGYGNLIQVSLQWDGTNSRWQFIRWTVQQPDNRYVLEQGDTMTGPLIMDDTTIQFTEGTDRLTLNWPVGTAPDKTISFPDASGTVALAGEVVSNTLTSANIIVGDASNNAVGVAMSGDTSITNAGVVTIANDAVTYAKMQDVGTANRVLGSTAAGGTVSEVQINRQMINASGNAANRVLAIDASGNDLVWVAQNQGVTYDLTCTQTGGNNDDPNITLTGSDASTDNVQIVGGENITVTRNDDNKLTIASGGSNITATGAFYKSGLNNYLNKFTFERNGTNYAAPNLPQGRGGASCVITSQGQYNQRSYIGGDGKYYIAGLMPNSLPVNCYYQAGIGLNLYQLNQMFVTPSFNIHPQTEAGIAGDAAYDKYTKGIDNTIDNNDTNTTTVHSITDPGVKLRYVHTCQNATYYLDENGTAWFSGYNGGYANGYGATTQKYNPIQVPAWTLSYTATPVANAFTYTADTTTSGVACSIGTNADAGGLLLDITTDATGAVITVDVVNNGTFDLRDGDVVTVAGDKINGGAVGEDLEVTITWDSNTRNVQQLVGTNKPKFTQWVSSYGDHTSVRSTNMTSYAVDEDGNVYTCGYNGHGQCGVGNVTAVRFLQRLPRGYFRTDPDDASTNKSIRMVFTTQYVVYALSDDGFVFAWGNNSKRLIGNGTNVNQTTPYCVNSHAKYDYPGFINFAPASDAAWVTDISNAAPDSETTTNGSGIEFDITFSAGVPTVVVSNPGNSKYVNGDTCTFNAATLGGGVNLVITLTDYNQMNGKTICHVVPNYVGGTVHYLDVDGSVYAHGYNADWGGDLGLSASANQTTNTGAASFTNNQYISWPRQLSLGGAGQANGTTAVYKDGGYQTSSGNQRVVHMCKAGTSTPTFYMITDGGEKTDGTPAQNWARMDYPRLYAFGYNAQGQSLRNFTNYRVNTGSSTVLSNWLPDQECEFYRLLDLGQQPEWNALNNNNPNWSPIQVGNADHGLGADVVLSQYTEEWFDEFGDSERIRQIFPFETTSTDRPICILTNNGTLFAGGRHSSTQNTMFQDVDNVSTSSIETDYTTVGYFYALAKVRAQPCKFKTFGYMGMSGFAATGGWYGINDDNEVWFGLGAYANENASDVASLGGVNGMKWDRAGQNYTLTPGVTTNMYGQDRGYRYGWRRGYLAS